MNEYILKGFLANKDKKFLLSEVNIMSSVFRDGQKVVSLLIKDGKDIEAGIKEAL